jgi:predicted nucleic acid-binding protein
VIYLDSAVLIAYTLTKLLEPEKYTYTAALMARINSGEITAVTSFYALHEVLIFALKNAPDPAKGRKLGKQALLEILQTNIEVLPMVTREERILNTRTFAALKDSSDVAHAISAYLNGCRAVVSYDEHFRDLPPVLTWKKPEEV